MQEVVAARMRYWDALDTLEAALVGTDKELSDKVVNDIESLAGGLNAPETAFERVTSDHLQTVIDLANA